MRVAGSSDRRKGWAQRLLDAEKGALLEDERAALTRTLGFLQDVVPDLAEVQCVCVCVCLRVCVCVCVRERECVCVCVCECV